LYGSFGTGKTHLLAAVCNAILLYAPPITSLFTTAPKLFNAIQERIQEREGYWGLIERAIATPLLVIDDIDKAKYSQFREEIYFAILDERVKARLPTAISTNRLSALTEYVGGSVCSRLKVGQVAAEMIGDDYREEM
jgi:DNA replication protein DnaC